MSRRKKGRKPILDTLLLPLVYPSAAVLKKVRKAGVHKLPRCKNALLRAGVFPIRNHFYEPQFDFRETAVDSSVPRTLPGIDWNVDEQLALLADLVYADELMDIPARNTSELEFHMENGLFESGDAEIWYQLIRHYKPKRIFEIGSGYSTLMAIKATQRNGAENPEYQCRHVCIEPYKMAWLEKTGVTIVRKRVEEVGVAFFEDLDDGDFLFIDSSHVIRPDGDVLFEYLELIPALRPGVIVHVHDIFSPGNYPDAWIRDEVRFWNEQYLLESFLSHNGSWKIVAALSYLCRNHYRALQAVCPFLSPDRAPGSFYMRRVV